MRFLLLATLLLSSATSSAIAQIVPITFPSDGGIVDVREYGAIPDDEGDDTTAIQAALDAYPNGNRIIYLPPGVFLIRDTLRWPAGESGGNAQKRTILQGAGETLSLLRLPENTGGFTDGGKPKPLLWTGSAPAQRFRNAVRDLTIEVGPRNAGAIGLQFNASNQGTIRHLTIRAADSSGKIGLDLGHCDEIGPLLVRHLTVTGFETGISTKWPVNSNTFEHVLLSNQRRLGWWNYHQMVFVRDLISENRVPSIYNEKDSWGTVTLLGAHLHAINPDGNTPAIHNQRQMYLRNVEILGYRLAVNHDDKGRDKGDVGPPGLIAEDTSHKNVRSLFREVGDGTFAQAGEVSHLPVKETPEIPWGDPAKEWANLLDFGADATGAADASAALARNGGWRAVPISGRKEDGGDRHEMERRLVDKLQAAGQLRPGLLVRALREHRLVLFEQTLAALGGFTSPQVHAAIRAPTAEPLYLACIAVGVDRAVAPRRRPGCGATGKSGDNAERNALPGTSGGQFHLAGGGVNAGKLRLRISWNWAGANPTADPV